MQVSMPSARMSILSMPKASMSSLSHSTTVRSTMAAFSMGTRSESGLLAMTKPPTCWERWRGVSISSSARRMVCSSSGIVGIEAGLAHIVEPEPVPAVAPDGLGERVQRVGREAHHLADLADGTLRPVADDRRGERRMVAAVALVDVLDHLLAALVLEIDVDIGRLVALGGDEALEEQVDPGRVDGGDAEHVADGGIGGRAPALAEDAFRAGEADDLLDGEEVGRISQLGDESKLVSQCLLDLLRHRVAVALEGTEPGQAFQLLMRRAAVISGLDRVVVGQLVEREAAAADDLEAALQRLWPVTEEPRHLGCGLEVALGIGEEAPTGRLDGAVLADAGDDVLQRAALGCVVVDVVGRQELDAVTAGLGGKTGDARLVVAGEAVAGHEVEAARPTRSQGRQQRVVGVDDSEEMAFVMRHDVGELEQALALAGAPLAERQQLREAAISRLVGGPGKERRAVGEVEADAGEKAQAQLLRLDVGADDAGEAVAVGDGDGGHAQLVSAQGQLLRVRGTAQEAEVGGYLELGVSGQGVRGRQRAERRVQARPASARRCPTADA